MYVKTASRDHCQDTVGIWCTSRFVLWGGRMVFDLLLLYYVFILAFFSCCCASYRGFVLDMFVLELDHCPVAEPLVQTSPVWPRYCTLTNTCAMMKIKSAHTNQEVWNLWLTGFDEFVDVHVCATVPRFAQHPADTSVPFWKRGAEPPVKTNWFVNGGCIYFKNKKYSFWLAIKCFSFKCHSAWDVYF